MTSRFPRLLSVLFVVSACEAPDKANDSKRSLASETEIQTTLSGVRVNPIKYLLAPKWKVQLHDGESTKWEVVSKLNLIEYRLGKKESLNEFKLKIEKLRIANDAAKIDGKKGFLPKGAAHAIDEISNLLQLLSSQISEQDRNDALTHIAELTESFNFNFEYPIPARVLEITAPITALDEYHHRAFIKRKNPAINIQAQGDTSQIDPQASSYWRNPGKISEKNLYVGFGRDQIPTFKDACIYDERKDSYGTHPGFTLKCNGKKWKFKFGEETKTEPFNSRLVWALGYNTIPVDYVYEVKVQYAREIIRDFNRRKDLSVAIESFLGFKYGKINLQTYYDPFRYGVRGAVLKDGTVLSSAQLRERLLSSVAERIEEKDENYNTAFESQIKWLVLNEASVETTLSDNEKNVGPWSWQTLDHPDRRETRGFGVIAIFLNMFDMRTDNNKIRIRTEQDGSKHLLHYISDLGSGLGRSQNLVSFVVGSVNDYPWIMLERECNKRQSAIHRAREEVLNCKYDEYDFKVPKFSATRTNKAFRNIHIEDARWIARKLAQVKESQLQDALIAAGWSAAEIKLYLEKMASRRDNMITVLGLAEVIPPMRPSGPNKNLTFDPRTNAPLSVFGQESIRAPDQGLKVVNGNVVNR